MAYGGADIAHETEHSARSLGPHTGEHAVCSLPSNGMAEAFVNFQVRLRPSHGPKRHPTILAQLPAAMEHSNEVRLRSSLKMHSRRASSDGNELASCA